VPPNINWDAISAIAKILGAVGVICSLICLATQIRCDALAATATATATANTTQLRATSARETFLTVAASKSLAGIIAKSSGEPAAWIQLLMDNKGLSHVEAIRHN